MIQIHRLILTLVMVTLMAAGLMLGGCAGTYRQLRSEDSVPALSALKKRSEASPNHTVLVPTQRQGEPDVNIAIHATGNRQKAPERVMVMIHGVLADHESWRFVTGAMIDDYHFLLVDLPGAGDSERPDPAKLGAGGYSPTALADRTLQALSVYLEGQKIKPKVTLVAHSFGGLVAIRMLSDPGLTGRYKSFLSQIDRVVLFSPADAEIINPAPVFRTLESVGPVELWIGDLLGMVSNRLARAERNGTPDPDKALREEADKRREMITDSGTLNILHAIYRDTVPQRDGKADWERIEKLTADYMNVKDIPFLIVWGARDATLPLAMGYKLEAQIPAAKLLVVPNQMHSIHIENPPLAVRIIREFDQSGSMPALGLK